MGMATPLNVHLPEEAEPRVSLLKELIVEEHGKTSLVAATAKIQCSFNTVVDDEVMEARDEERKEGGSNMDVDEGGQYIYSSGVCRRHIVK